MEVLARFWYLGQLLLCLDALHDFIENDKLRYPADPAAIYLMYQQTPAMQRAWRTHQVTASSQGCCLRCYRPSMNQILEILGQQTWHTQTEGSCTFRYRLDS